LSRATAEAAGNPGEAAVLYCQFDKALENREITAWIAANDSVAVCALDYLRARDACIPGDLSIISFDDTIWAFTRQFTSYNFNVDAVVAAMIRHIEDGAGRRGKAERRFVEIDGYIVERSTVGKARKCH
jgi:DNA-binding LacI/PurR family transcriptional regulator